MRTIPLHGKKAAGRVALVDDGDYDLVMRYRWCVEEKQRTGARGQLLTKGPYAVANVPHAEGRGLIYMHNLIMGYKGVDHANGDGLDNQRSNLRAATVAQNGANQRARTDGTSSFKGVSWCRDTSKWLAVMSVGGHRRHLGRFTSEEDAAKAYDAAAREAFGEFARTNFPA